VSGVINYSCDDSFRLRTSTPRIPKGAHHAQRRAGRDTMRMAYIYIYMYTYMYINVYIYICISMYIYLAKKRRWLKPTQARRRPGRRRCKKRTNFWGQMSYYQWHWHIFRSIKGMTQSQARKEGKEAQAVGSLQSRAIDCCMIRSFCVSVAFSPSSRPPSTATSNILFREDLLSHEYAPPRLYVSRANSLV